MVVSWLSRHRWRARHHDRLTWCAIVWRAVCLVERTSARPTLGCSTGSDHACGRPRAAAERMKAITVLSSHMMVCRRSPRCRTLTSVANTVHDKAKIK